MSWVQVFGGQTVYPAQLTYLPLALVADVTLEWPVEQAMPGALVFADIIDVDASAPGLAITLPAANEGSNGAATLINNLGANTVTVRNAVGGTVLSLPSGTAWEVYLADNTTAAGVWRTFQFGASVSVVNAAALAGAGLKAIGATLNQSMPPRSFAVDYVVVDSDRAQALVWTSGLGLFTLPTPGAVGSDWFIGVRNSGSGDLSVTPPIPTLIDGAASKTFPPGTSAFIVCDGASYFTLGFGSGAAGGGSGFDFVTIDVSGAGNFILAGAQLNRIGYQFIGVLTGTRNIVVPNTTQEYWVTNSTTGAFSLFVKTVAQVPGVEVLQNNRNILYCDGTNVVPAESATVSFPIAIAQGGTGATTAPNARTNLGGTSVGQAVFTAVDQAAAQTAIAAVPTSRQVATGAGLSGGGNLTADRTLIVDQNFNFAFTGTITYGGVEVGWKLLPQNNTNPNYTLVAADAAKHMYATGGIGNTWTIPSNAAVPYPIGTVLTFVNRSGGNISIAINTDTLVLAAAGTTGTRTLANNGWAQAMKIASNTWIISGIGLT